MVPSGLSLLIASLGAWAWGANLHYLYLIRIVRCAPSAPPPLRHPSADDAAVRRMFRP